MRIGIDISQIVYGTGVSVYTKKLVENLLLQGDQDPLLLFAGILRQRAELEKIVGTFSGSNYKKVFVPITPTLSDLLWNRIHILPIETLVGKVDVFHSSDWTEPPARASKVTTVHDLWPILYPKLTDKRIRVVHERKLNWSLKECKRIIVPSLSTKADLVNFGYPEKFVRVIPEAPVVTPQTVSPFDFQKLAIKHKISGKYILTIGANKRKNIDNILKAFSLATGKADYKLVVVGRPGDAIQAEQRGVRWLGHVTDAELGALYKNAEMLLYPSLYEGFGIPILEAFSFGCPVVTSSVSSMPEVGGKAAIYVDPNEPDSIFDGITQASKRRKVLVELGRTELAKYSWKKVAEETMGVYKELI